ncbi:RNA polymerase II-associated protein 3-like isoform X2 [Pectinophora gossypiella]|uniref:RNA polymerase II-associated protein 3-like isoform X2 n=1 Tax=Pectinophora gossypiella TaxID=13191 RepID=UPI00214EED83|nr:RNA polymerase II-associated protein 3-like isoform X2 [Pectinophora gossypiella]
MEKAFEIQKQVRDNAMTLQTYLTDLQNWESDMKRKEAALNGVFEQDLELPPVRSKIKKEKPVVVKKKPEKRIRGSDYSSWDKFDVDKACEEVDMAEVGPPSLDSKKSQQAKLEKLKEEAQYEKERGNTFVKQEKWDEAIACYNRAIELVKDDAIYYANRGLCYLKKDSLHQAESDCSEALRLDPSYVKALQRRATARERLGSLRSASHDLSEVLKLEPHNNAARIQLQAIKARMGTKGARITELPDEPKQPVPQVDKMEQWRNGVGEAVTVIKTVKKPPHLRSKRALKPVPIHEISLGKTSPEKPPTRLKIIEIEDNLAHGDTNNNDSIKIDKLTEKIDTKGEGDKIEDNDSLKSNKMSPESEKIVTDILASEKDACVQNLVAPVSSVQFMATWKYLKGKGGARSDYLNIIDPQKIPSIFANALESDVLSELLMILAENPGKFRYQTVAAYLKGLCKVKRFSTLAMFLSNSDKQLLTKLLAHCKANENCSEEEIADLKNKYEL